ncbi:hypothetical protein Bbelb_070420 [Branchiostoma belcheri]|nr:hypothetical protein Bbelb_070420 [Branchiostoma belcheri]
MVHPDVYDFEVPFPFDPLGAYKEHLLARETWITREMDGKTIVLPSIEDVASGNIKASADLLMARIVSGAVTVWGKVESVAPPYKVMPLKVEATKPRLCRDLRPDGLLSTISGHQQDVRPPGRGVMAARLFTATIICGLLFTTARNIFFDPPPDVNNIHWKKKNDVYTSNGRKTFPPAWSVEDVQTI